MEATQEIQVTPVARKETASPSALKPSKTERSSFRAGGALPTTLCLAKAAIGAGVLSMGFHCAEVGLLYTLVCLVMGAALTVISIQLIAKASVATGRWSFEDVSEELLHPSLALWTGIVNTLNCLGAAAAYLIVCGQVFVVITGLDNSWRQGFIVAVGLGVCAPMALAPHVAFMRHLAALSIMAIMLLVVCVVAQSAENGIDPSVTSETLWYGHGGATVFTYMNMVNNMIFAYNNQFNVPQLTGELTPEPEVKRMTLVGVLSSGLSLTLYASVSIAGVLAFGVEHQQDSFVQDLAPAMPNAFVSTALLGTMFSVIICFQFHIYPIRQFCAYNLRKVRGLAADAEDEKMILGRSLARWVDMGCGLSAVLITVLIAVVMTEIRVILEFVGAFAGAWISYVVPALWVIQVRRRAEGFSWFDAEVLGCVALFLLGMFLFVFGTYAAI